VRRVPDNRDDIINAARPPGAAVQFDSFRGKGDTAKFAGLLLIGYFAFMMSPGPLNAYSAAKAKHAYRPEATQGWPLAVTVGQFRRDGPPPCTCLEFRGVARRLRRTIRFNAAAGQQSQRKSSRQSMRTGTRVDSDLQEWTGGFIEQTTGQLDLLNQTRCGHTKT
jgi:hypothetical protein